MDEIVKWIAQQQYDQVVGELHYFSPIPEQLDIQKIVQKNVEQEE